MKKTQFIETSQNWSPQTINHSNEKNEGETLVETIKYIPTVISKHPWRMVMRRKHGLRKKKKTPLLLCWAPCGCGCLLWCGRMGWWIIVTCLPSEHTPKQMTRVGLSNDAPWHGVAWLVHDHPSTHKAKVELESGWMSQHHTNTATKSSHLCLLWVTALPFFSLI